MFFSHIERNLRRYTWLAVVLLSAAFWGGVIWGMFCLMTP